MKAGRIWGMLLLAQLVLSGCRSPMDSEPNKPNLANDSASAIQEETDTLEYGLPGMPNPGMPGRASYESCGEKFLLFTSILLTVDLWSLIRIPPLD